MPKKKYKAIPLAGATKILRAHSTDIEPPGLIELKNLFTSRSDNAVALRSDWEAAYPGMFSYGDLIQGGDHEDYLNAGFYVTRAGHTIWLGRLAPFTWSGGDFGQMFTTYDTGTISTDGIKTEVIGVETEWLQQIWPGCLIRFKGEDNNLYPITDVTSDTRMLTSALMPVSDTVEYVIFRVHPLNRAEWPLRTAALGGYLIYGSVDINQPIDEKYISGPFFANINRPNLGVWFGSNPDIDEADILTSSVAVVRPLGAVVAGISTPRIRGPIIVGADKGTVFIRDPWDRSFRHDISYREAFELPTKAIDLGYRDTWTRVISQDFWKFWALSLEGGVIKFTLRSKDSLYDGSELVYYGDVVSEQQKYRPFGRVGLFGKTQVSFSGEDADLFFGANGTLGVLDGTTFSTGVDSTLRDGCEVDGGSTYIIVGDDDGSSAVILTFSQSDFPNSLNRETSGVSGESLLSVAYLPRYDRIVAVGTGGTCITSDDAGSTWTPRTVGTAKDLQSVTADLSGHRLVAVGEKVFYSLDGITWEEEDLGKDFVSVAFNPYNGNFYALDEDDDVWRLRIIAYIGDTYTNMGSFGEASDFVCDVQHDGSQFVAVGNKIWTSSDAVSWTERKTPSSTLLSVAKHSSGGSDIWVAVGLDGVIYRSANDAVAWSPISSGVTGDLNQVIHDSANFLVAGNGGKILKSEDGTSWGAMSFPSNTNLMTIATNGGSWGSSRATVWAVGADGNVYYNRNYYGAYLPWALWEYSPTDATWTVAGNMGISTGGLRGMRTISSVSAGGNICQLILAGNAHFLGYDTVGFENNEVEGSVYGVVVTWYGNFVYPGSNCMCKLEPAGRAVNPIIVANFKSPAINNLMLTSVDGGVSWSTIEPPAPAGSDEGNPTDYGVARPVFLGGRLFFPICHDGTDVFMVIGSNRSVGAPYTQKASGWVIDLQEAEVI